MLAFGLVWMLGLHVCLWFAVVVGFVVVYGWAFFGVVVFVNDYLTLFVCVFVGYRVICISSGLLLFGYRYGFVCRLVAGVYACYSWLLVSWLFCLLFGACYFAGLVVVFIVFLVSF